MAIIPAVKVLLKWAAPKIITGAKFLGKAATKGSAKFVNLVTRKASSAILRGGAKLAASTTKPFIAKTALKVSEKLAKESFLKPIVKDLTFKAAKEVVSKIPVVGEPARKIMDIADAAIGIPFI